MKRISLTEIDQFGYNVNNSGWHINDVKTNKIIIDFGDRSYVFDGNGRLLESNELLSSTQITKEELLTLNKDEQSL